MAIVTSNVMVGAATLYTAVANTPAPPAGIPLGGTWPTPWVAVGGTEQGVTMSYDPKVNELFIEEQPTPVLTPIDTLDISFSAIFAEDIMANIQLAYGTGANTTTALSAGRTFSDGVVAATTTMTSATAAFVAGDVGRTVTDTTTPTAYPAGTYIVSVTNGTTVILSNPGSGALTAQSITLGAIPARTTYTPGSTTNNYAVGLEATNSFGLYRRAYVPVATSASNKIDTVFRRAKNYRMYPATFRSICAINQIQLVEATA